VQNGSGNMPTTLGSAVAPKLAEKLQRAVEDHQSGQLAEARAAYEEILAVDPRHADAMNLLGAIAIQTKDFQHAVQLYAQAIEVDPANLVAYCNSALALGALKQFEAALARYDQAIALRADLAESYFNRGNVLWTLKRLDAALASYRQAIALDPEYAEGYLGCGHVLRDLKQWEAARASYEQAIALVEDYEQAHFHRGNVLYELKQWEGALASYNRTIAIKPDFAEAYSNRGLVLYELKQWEGALASYKRAIELRANYAEAHFNCGNVLQALKQPDAALASYNRAIELKPDHAEVHFNRGNTLYELKQLDAALTSYSLAIKLNRDYAEAYSNRGIVLKELNQLEAALASYQQAIDVNPGYADAHFNRGNALVQLKQLDAAQTSYARALELKPDEKWMYGAWLHTKMLLCNWKDLETELPRMASKIESAEMATQPFVVLALADSPPLQRRAAEIWARETCPLNLALPSIGPRPRDSQIRVGYFSADLHHSAMSHLMVNIFRAHDKRQFRVIAFSFGPDIQDEMRERLLPAFDEFIDVRAKSPLEIAQMARERGIDIAVDLMGFTRNQRSEIFAHRAAPIQVSYLGYPGTLGTSYIDYILADRTVIPDKNRRHYAERVSYLPYSYFPTSYQIAEHPGRIDDPQSRRAELGLPPVGFVFCCFNNRYKITPAVFDIWMRLLSQVEGSVLWLLQDDEVCVRNLRREAQTRGVDAARLIFAPRAPSASHLARHGVADLFLDTLPCNAHTTAADALWMGVPVLTRIGEAFASRVAASLLHAVGLPELITTTAEQYEAAAIGLAKDPERLARLKDKLNGNRLTASLFNSELLTQHLERAFVQMYERYQQGLPAVDLVLSSAANSQLPTPWMQ
jgi:protein O-GlcNAc transferase